MKKSMRALLGIALPVITIVSFAMLLAFSLMRLSNIEQDMRLEASENMLWVISRAHLASLQLSETATKRALDETEQSDLDLRYNVFLSRLALLDEGPQRRQIEKLGFSPALGEFRQNLTKFTVFTTDLKPGDTQRAQAITLLLTPYNTMLTQAANKAMVAEWDDLGNKLDTSRKHLWQIIISLIGISLAGAVLSIHFLLVTRDVRQRTRLLDKEKAFSELLIGSSGEGIIAVDIEGHCTVWNNAAERLFGLSAAKAIGRTIGDVSGFFQIDRIRHAIATARTGQTATLLDQPFFHSDQNEPLYIDLRCFSLRDGERIIGAILLVSDVTERRAAQREIAEHRDHLEHLVRERTQELDAALARERVTADLYRNFGAMISHQFRTPLAIVDSALQRLMRRSDKLSSAEVLERGGQARNAITRLTKLVESTLDAARLDAGQIKIRTQPCDLGKLTAEICARQDGETANRRIILKIPASQSVIAYCDPVHAEHVLVNLLSNAIKYSPPETQITISVSSEGGMAECSVINYGALLCVDEQDNLFERYFRGQNAEGRPGIGIGLYMARALAHMQGGDVQLRDAGKDQVCFTLSLPLEARPIVDFTLSSFEKPT